MTDQPRDAARWAETGGRALAETGFALLGVGAGLADLIRDGRLQRGLSQAGRWTVKASGATGRALRDGFEALARRGHGLVDASREHEPPRPTPPQEPAPHPGDAAAPPPDYAELTVAELRELARGADIEGRYQMKKLQLVAALEARDEKTATV